MDNATKMRIRLEAAESQGTENLRRINEFGGTLQALKKIVAQVDTAQLNAQAVIGKLQDFEVRIGEQDQKLEHMQRKLLELERLNEKLNTEAIASKFGSGPTS